MAEAIGNEPTEAEASAELLEMARGKTGAVPGGDLVALVMAATGDGGWPVRREGMNALLRRQLSATRDGLRVAATPAGSRPLGIYRTASARSAARPYRTAISAVRPIAASCDCPDFLRNALGLCKHVLAVLDHLHRRPRALRAALAAQESEAGGRRPALLWDPVRPLGGAGDWLERIALHPGSGSPRAAVRLPETARRLFAAGAAGSSRPLADAHAADPARRLRLVEALQGLIGAGGGRHGPRLATVPAVPALLAAERDRLRLLVAHQLAPREVDAAIATMKQKPYAYQRQGVQRFLGEGRLLLADDMGLGKTAQAIAACHILWRTERVQRGLLIVPASLKPQWLREWGQFTDAPIAAVDGSPAERRAAYRRAARGYLVINYEQLLRDFDSVARWRPEVVVLDEAQRIKNWETKSAAYVKSLRPRYRLVLTGTPMENRIDELASIYDWVDSFALEPKWRLAPWHVVTADGGREVDGVRHLDTLRARLAPTMVRRTRREVLDQLPARTDTVVPVEMTMAQAEEHDALIVPIAAVLQRARRRPLTQAEFLRLMQLLTTQRIIANGLAQLRFTEIWPGLAAAPPVPSLLDTLATPKLAELRELIDQIALRQRRKVVVFSQWRRMLELACWATRDLLARGGQRAVFFTGRESRARRTQNLIELHDDAGVSVLFASDAGGVGLNLQRAASCCINIDLPWNPAVLEQRIGRIHRLGQQQPIDVYNLVSQGSIEARIATLIADKRALFSSLFDGGSDEVRFERSGTFLAQLRRVVEPLAVPEPEDGAADRQEPPFDRAVDALVAAADENADAITPAPPAAAAAALAGVPPDAARLLAGLRLSPTPDGGLRLEAPPEAAGTLAAIFDGLARLLRAQSDERAAR